MEHIQIPEAIKHHEEDFMPGAWQDYSEADCCTWVRLLMERAQRRTNLSKKLKDLLDAYNYLVMFIAKVEAGRQADEETTHGGPLSGVKVNEVKRPLPDLPPHSDGDIEGANRHCLNLPPDSIPRGY